MTEYGRKGWGEAKGKKRREGKGGEKISAEKEDELSSPLLLFRLWERTNEHGGRERRGVFGSKGEEKGGGTLVTRNVNVRRRRSEQGHYVHQR